MRLKVAILLSVAALAAGAAEFVVTNFTGSLHDAATYENAAVPGADDVIVWTNIATHTLEEPLAVKGVRVNLANSPNQVTINGAALTIGESGVEHVKGTLSFRAPVILATNQTWNVPASGDSLNVADLSGPDFVLTTTGNGNVLYLGSVDVGEISSSNGPSFLRVDACISATTHLRMYPSKTLYEDMSKDFDLRDVLPLSATTNLNGILLVGRHAYNPQKLDVTVTLQPGDRLADSVENTADRGTARLDFGGHTLENRGGEIDMRWSYAYTGAYRQYSGNAVFFYDFNAGILPESYQSTATVNNRPFEFYMGGGTFTARRMEIGCATDWSRPTHAVFAGGMTLLSNDTPYAGMAVALANGPTGTRVYRDPDARLEVTGDAVVNARGIWFGTYADSGAASFHATVTNGYGELLLTGGELYIGKSGIRTAPARWMPTADGTNTWVTLRMAGGQLGAAPVTDEAGGIYVPITLDGTNNTFACQNASGSGHSLYLYGPIVGNGGFTKTGDGAMRVYGEHLATGKVMIADGTLMYYNPAATAEVVRTEVEVPAATFGWTADSLAGNAGTAVSSWGPTNVASAGANTFAVSPLASLGITAPKISAETMNGHRTLAFNAADGSGLGMGGSNARTLLGSPTSMTWAFVFRTPTNAPVFKNGGNNYANNISALFGRTWKTQQLAVLLRTDGSVGFGIKEAEDMTVPFETVWAPQRDTRFNDTHVLFVTWDGATDTYSVTMDGYTQSSTLQTPLGKFADSAITVGLIDHRGRSNVKFSDSHFTGEIAEIRYYKNAVLTAAQRAQLGRELAERYGAPIYAYLTAEEKTNAVGLGAREYEIQKTSSAAIGGLKGDHELYLGDGQRIWGSGNVNSGLTLLSGAILDMAHPGDGLAFRNPTSFPPNTHGLTLDGGAIVRFAYHDDGVTSAPTTVSQLTVRGTNVIQVVSTNDQPAPRGVVFQADESMTIEEGATFVLEGARNATRVVVDATAKTVSLETSLGTTVIFR